MALGNGVTETTGYNNRLQPVSMQAGSLLTLGYAYCPNGGTSCSTNNGNLLRQTVGIGSWNRTVDYTYGDAMNRLTAAVETGGNSEWSRTYGYDAYGNRWVSTWSAALPPASGTPTTSGWFDSNNRLTGVTFDTAGNQTSLLGYGFTYDAESRQKTATVNTATTQYSYDGDGRRVKTVSGGVATVYVYDAQGLLAAEYGGAGSPTGGTQYLSADHLGSTRLVTDSSTAVVKRYDYLPFGEEIPVGIGDRTTGQGYGADAFRIKFTGKERDAETGLDYFGARYFSAAQGRFTSPDPTFMTRQRISDPQQWNLYSYVRNNPLMFVDPDGRELRLAVFNSSKYSSPVVQRATQIVADRFRAAGVQNVSTVIRGGVPGAFDHLRQGAVGAAAFLTGSQRSHMAEVRPGAEGVGIANSGIKAGEAGLNFAGSSAVDASHVAGKTDNAENAAVGLANLMTHEIGHDVFINHSSSPDNAMFGAASADWLFNPDVAFSPEQAKVIRDRFNTAEEQKAWAEQQKKKKEEEQRQ